MTWTFEFLTKSRAFNKRATDTRPTPDKIVTVEAANELEATTAAFATLRPREIRSLICANVLRPETGR